MHLYFLRHGEADWPNWKKRGDERPLTEAGKSEMREVEFAVTQLKKSLVADYVVLGGGNTKKLDSLPKGVERGHNRNAFLGGTRLWQIEPRTRRPKWRIL